MLQEVMNPFAGTLYSTIPFVHGSCPPKNVFDNRVAVKGTMLSRPRHLSPRNIWLRRQHVACVQTASAHNADNPNATYHARYYIQKCV